LLIKHVHDLLINTTSSSICHDGRKHIVNARWNWCPGARKVNANSDQTFLKIWWWRLSSWIQISSSWFLCVRMYGGDHWSDRHLWCPPSTTRTVVDTHSSDFGHRHGRTWNYGFWLFDIRWPHEGYRTDMSRCRPSAEEDLQCPVWWSWPLEVYSMLFAIAIQLILIWSSINYYAFVKMFHRRTCYDLNSSNSIIRTMADLAGTQEEEAIISRPNFKIVKVPSPMWPTYTPKQFQGRNGSRLEAARKHLAFSGVNKLNVPSKWSDQWWQQSRRMSTGHRDWGQKITIYL